MTGHNGEGQIEMASHWKQAYFKHGRITDLPLNGSARTLAKDMRA